MGSKEPKSHSDAGSPCASKLVRSSNFRDSCSNPQAMPTGSDPWPNQIHHILCEHAILDINPDSDKDGKKRTYIDECLCIADYDINEESNLIGLPLKPAYIDSDGEVPKNLPCHDVDHNGTPGNYTDECKQWLHDNIWNTLIDRRKAHATSADEIVAALRQCTGVFKGKLTKRGKRGPGVGGTRYSWKNRFKHPEDWMMPFSMSGDPNYRSPGAPNPKPLFEILKKIF